MYALPLLDRVDLHAVHDACVAAGLRIEPLRGRLAELAVRVHTTDGHPPQDAHAPGWATLPLTRELVDWPARLAETLTLLRTVTGDTHVQLGPLTDHEAAFAAVPAVPTTTGDVADLAGRIADAYEQLARFDTAPGDLRALLSREGHPEDHVRAALDGHPTVSPSQQLPASAATARSPDRTGTSSTPGAPLMTTPPDLTDLRQAAERARASLGEDGSNDAEHDALIDLLDAVDRLADDRTLTTLHERFKGDDRTQVHASRAGAVAEALRSLTDWSTDDYVAALEGGYRHLDELAAASGLPTDPDDPFDTPTVIDHLEALLDAGELDTATRHIDLLVAQACAAGHHGWVQLTPTTVLP